MCSIWLHQACTTSSQGINPGPRPIALVAGLPSSALKTQLTDCAAGPFYRSSFSISHRGAPLAYPEHTKEGYLAAAAMGAGIIECDVTFTKDLSLVCRHSQCDLHRTTNILQTDLAANCTAGFQPAAGDRPAGAKCCTSDITLAEYRSLCGRRDAVNPQATSIDAYLTAPVPKVDVAGTACGTLMTHAESIQLIDQLDRDFTPELKRPLVDMPFKGMTETEYADRMLEEYVAAGIAPARVRPQSFDINVIRHWVANHPTFAEQAVYLDPRGRDRNFKPSLQGMQALKDAGIKIVAPPMPMLLTLDAEGELQASAYAKFARAAGLDIITWTFEAGEATDPNNWLYANLAGFMTHESKMLVVLEALHKKVGIKGIFSDWPGTVTYYASCAGL